MWRSQKLMQCPRDGSEHRGWAPGRMPPNVRVLPPGFGLWRSADWTGCSRFLSLKALGSPFFLLFTPRSRQRIAAESCSGNFGLQLGEVQTTACRTRCSAACLCLTSSFLYYVNLFSMFGPACILIQYTYEQLDLGLVFDDGSSPMFLNDSMTSI